MCQSGAQAATNWLPVPCLRQPAWHPPPVSLHPSPSDVSLSNSLLLFKGAQPSASPATTAGVGAKGEVARNAVGIQKRQRAWSVQTQETPEPRHTTCPHPRQQQWTQDVQSPRATIDCHKQERLKVTTITQADRSADRTAGRRSGHFDIGLLKYGPAHPTPPQRHC